MQSDPGRLPAPVSAAAPGAGSAVIAGELLGRVRAELPAVGAAGEREQVLESAWLTGLRSARTRRAYAGDVVAWLGWLTEREADALAAGRVHLDLWAATQLGEGRRPPACAAAWRRCRRSTGTARPMT
jgi:integrase/recombinase XerD